MTDRELLEMAAKAAGVVGAWDQMHLTYGDMLLEGINNGSPIFWNPLADDGDAMRLANRLSIDVLHNWESITAQWEQGKFCREKCADETRDKATRRAITRAAAEIGASMQKSTATN